MKKLICLMAVLAVCTAAPRQLTAATDGAPAAKTQVCHVSGQANDEIPELSVRFGQVIEVNDNAVAAHVDHGDSTGFFTMDEVLKGMVEEIWGISLVNADCYIWD